MVGKPTEQLELECANLLQEFGFTQYEAYTFVYLLRLGSGTARDVAEMDGVPRTRVYDAVDTLEAAGLVDVQYGSPQRYTPVSLETAIRKLDVDRKNTIDELADLLHQLEPADVQPQEFGVWTVTGRDVVALRVLEFIDDATEQIVYMTVDELLSETHLDALVEAEARGVDIHLAGVSDPLRARVQERLPSADIFETLWAWSEEGAGQLVVTDKQTALVSVLLDEGSERAPEEVAIWGSGAQNSLVVVLRAIFTWRLGGGPGPVQPVE